MTASLDDLITGTTDGSRPLVTTLTSQKSLGASTINCDSLSGWETGTAVHFAIYMVDAQGLKVAGSQTDWKGVVSGTDITIETTPRAGSDQIYPIGSVVECMPTAAWADDLASGLLEQHNADGTHHDITTDAITVATSITIPNDSIPASKMLGVDLFGLGAALDGTPPSAGTGQFYMQAGTVVVVTNGSGTGSFNWPSAFPNGLLTAVSVEGDATAGNNHFRLLNSTKTGTQFNFQGMGANTVRINYIAIGF